jgi:hypothetical protein
MTPPGGHSVSFDSAATLEVLVTGRVCVGECCYPIVQWVHGRVYSEGDSYIAWHQPANPLRNGKMATEDAAIGQGYMQLWQAWAETTE